MCVGGGLKTRAHFFLHAQVSNLAFVLTGMIVFNCGVADLRSWVRRRLPLSPDRVWVGGNWAEQKSLMIQHPLHSA